MVASVIRFFIGVGVEDADERVMLYSGAAGSFGYHTWANIVEDEELFRKASYDCIRDEVQHKLWCAIQFARETGINRGSTITSFKFRGSKGFNKWYAKNWLDGNGDPIWKEDDEQSVCTWERVLDSPCSEDVSTDDGDVSTDDGGDGKSTKKQKKEKDGESNDEDDEEPPKKKQKK